MIRSIAFTIVALSCALWSRPADACGCFAPSTTITPVIQAGERIVFAVRDGKVIAHVQIQYSGNASDFGWLLPLPSVPTLKTGSDELFNRLLEETDPVFTTAGNVKCRPIQLGCAFAPARLASNRGTDGTVDAGTVAVKQGSVGPYDFAVLSAADKTAMLKWLNDNRYFIPTGTDSAVDPYINPGAYFLALKLQSDRSAGDVTPIVLEYESSYPMIPITLTSVGATPNMGVQVFMLGQGRGIPRNYAHVTINDALLNWASGVTNYSEIVTRAVGEAPGKHAFVTDYAGPTTPLKLPFSRFGSEADLAAATTPEAFVAQLKSAQFDRADNFDPLVVSLIVKQLPVPAAVGVDANTWVNSLGYYLGQYRTENPDKFTGYTATLDAPALAHDIFTQYVKPTREAFALFDEFPKLTRLYTTLNPEDMNVDPVFAFNASLPDVAREHRSIQDFGCGETEVTTEQGWMVKPSTKLDGLPAALSIATVPEEGTPTILTNNIAKIHQKVPLLDTSETAAQQQGCSSVDPVSLLSFAALVAFSRRARRRTGTTA
ncbi:MAG: DUF2330 domain-containing protein [Archangium sp.]